MPVKEIIFKQILQTEEKILAIADELFGTCDVEEIRIQTYQLTCDEDENFMSEGCFYRHGKEGTKSRNEALAKLSCGMALFKLVNALEAFAINDIELALTKLGESNFLTGCSVAGNSALLENSIMAMVKGYQPKFKKENIRSLVIDAMRNYRKDDHTLKDFVESAKNGSVQWLEIESANEPTSATDPTLYSLEWTEPGKECSDLSKSYKTLETWWTEANK